MSSNNKTIYNFANFLSISRILATFPLIYCFENFHYSDFYIYYSIFIIVFIFLSDILDGFFARISNTVTDFGKVIDPIADKVCMLVVLIYLIDSYKGDPFTNPFLFFYILLCIRDITIIVFSLYNITHNKHVSQANIAGKLFIFLSSMMIIFYIYNINNFIAFIFYVSSILTMLCSMYLYIRDSKEVINSEHS